MIIDCISDLHGYMPTLQGGDLLIIAGDLTAHDTDREHWDFAEKLGYQQMFEERYDKIIYIAGNHDGYLDPATGRRGIIRTCKWWDVEYLCDSGTEYRGKKIWGSPWTPVFYDWHFMKKRGKDIKKMWDMIPEDTEILITHGPPFGIQDQVENIHKDNVGNFAGCEELSNTIRDRLKNLKLHVFGHIHGCYGKANVNGVTYVNASIMNEYYQPVNDPIRIILE